MIDISIVIPFRNLFHELENCITGILNQNIESKFEIIILDSSDESFEKLIYNLSNQIKYLRINPKTFNHGLTRQYALNFCKGRYIVYTVQDAVPIGNKWLYNLIQPLIDNNLDAICGKQIVLDDKDKNPVQWFRPLDSPEIRVVNVSPHEYNNKLPYQRRELTRWDNVNACYRKEILEKLPFANLNFGEDTFWADSALKNGLKIGYTCYSKVDHYHHYDQIQQVVRRIIAENLIMKKTYDLDPCPQQINLRRYISILKRIFLSNIQLLDKFYWIKYNVQLELSYFKAYKTWISFASLIQAEEYINNKVPQSIKNGRK